MVKQNKMTMGLIDSCGTGASIFSISITHQLIIKFCIPLKFYNNKSYMNIDVHEAARSH